MVYECQNQFATSYLLMPYKALFQQPRSSPDCNIIPRMIFLDSKPKQQSSAISLFDLQRIKDLMLMPGVGFIYLMKLIAGMPFGIFQSMFAMVLVNTFGLTPAQHGMFMSYIGSLMIVSSSL